MRIGGLPWSVFPSVLSRKTGVCRADCPFGIKVISTVILTGENAALHISTGIFDGFPSKYYMCQCYRNWIILTQKLTTVGRNRKTFY